MPSMLGLGLGLGLGVVKRRHAGEDLTLEEFERGAASRGNVRHLRSQAWLGLGLGLGLAREARRRICERNTCETYGRPGMQG